MNGNQTHLFGVHLFSNLGNKRFSLGHFWFLPRPIRPSAIKRCHARHHQTNGVGVASERTDGMFLLEGDS